MPDISPICRFLFYQPVYCAAIQPSFLSKSREIGRRFVGVAEHVGHMMTFLILNEDTNKVVEQSLVRSVDPTALNKKVADIHNMTSSS